MAIFAFGRRMRDSGVLASAAVGASFVVSVVLLFTLLGRSSSNRLLVQHVWSWIHVGSFHADVTLRADPLSIVMALVVTGVGCLIHVYAIGYMEGDPRYNRFFAQLNLFVFFMLLLVLADNFLLLYVGWEGVGLCSYLLIGHWQDRPVTAGVYLVVRTHVFFEVSGVALTVVLIGGLVTALYAALSALGQDDYKRVLAYSTMSQIGYMFFACGLHAYSVAILLLVMHAFYKALLFMGAGSVMHALDGETDLKRMRGLRVALPFTFACFIIGWL